MRKVFLSLAGLALIAAPAAAAPPYNKVVTVGQQAPAFAGIPAVMGAEETSLTLGDIKDDVVVLVFLANHCPVVTSTEDRIIDLANQYKGKGVKFVAVSVNPNNEDRLPGIKQRVQEKKYPFAYGYDESQKIGKAYGASATPQFFVIDKKRAIQYTGAMDDNARDETKVTKTYLKDAIDAVLKGDSPEVKETAAVGCGIQYKRSLND